MYFNSFKLTLKRLAAMKIMGFAVFSNTETTIKIYATEANHDNTQLNLYLLITLSDCVTQWCEILHKTCVIYGIIESIVDFSILYLHRNQTKSNATLIFYKRIQLHTIKSTLNYSCCFCFCSMTKI